MFESAFEERLYNERRQKLEKIAALGVGIAQNSYHATISIPQVLACYQSYSSFDLENTPVRVSLVGRIVAIRHQGKSGFIQLWQDGQTIQLYVRKDVIGDTMFALYRLLDLGDHVGVTGTVMRTHSGELSIRLDSITFLSKAMFTLPDKYHGLEDTELRYRHRQCDLITNNNSRDIFVKRSAIIKELREFLDSRDYLEVETPMLHSLAGGAAARPFITHHNALDIPLYLRIAPELYLKRLVVGGFERVYEINRNFRNEGVSTKHNPEFTMLEFYQAYASYHTMMDITEELIPHIARCVNNTTIINFNGQSIDLSRWTRMTMRDSIRNFGGDASIEDGNLLVAEFERMVEPHLIQPTIIYDYPIEVSPLAKRKVDNPKITERFEFYIGGMEIGNAFSELNDVQDQYERFQKQQQDQQDESKTGAIDMDYVRALGHGLPPTAGQGIGIDRLTMLLTGANSIRDVILFPLLRPRANKLT